MNYRVVAKELNIPYESVESYFKFSHLTRIYPIRDLTPIEQETVKIMKDMKYYARTDLIDFLNSLDLTYDEYFSNPMIAVKHHLSIPDDQFDIMVKYYSLLIEPAYKYHNFNAYKLSPLTPDDIVLLLTNFAVGNSTPNSSGVPIPISPKIQMEALRELRNLYGIEKFIPAGSESSIEKKEQDIKIKKLNESQLIRLINKVDPDNFIETANIPDLLTMDQIGPDGLPLPDLDNDLNVISDNKIIKETIKDKKLYKPNKDAKVKIPKASPDDVLKDIKDFKRKRSKKQKQAISNGESESKEVIKPSDNKSRQTKGRQKKVKESSPEVMVLADE